MTENLLPEPVEPLSAEDEAFLARTLPLAEAEMTALVARQEASLAFRHDMIVTLREHLAKMQAANEKMRQVLHLAG